MACPVCGVRCTCPPPEDASGARVSVVLDPDSYHSLEQHPEYAAEPPVPRVNVLVDPELRSAGEDQFAASLESESARLPEEDPLGLEDDGSQFLGASSSGDGSEEGPGEVMTSGRSAETNGSARRESGVLDEPLAGLVAPSTAPPPNGEKDAGPTARTTTSANGGSSSATPCAPQAARTNGSGWREEVANRLDAYRSRRRRRSSEQSLSLNFEQPEGAAGGDRASSKLIRFPRPPIVGTAVLDQPVHTEPDTAGAPLAECALQDALARAASVATEQREATGELSADDLGDAAASSPPVEELAEPVEDWSSSAIYEPETEPPAETAPALAMTLEELEDAHEDAAPFARFAAAEREFVMEMPLQAAPMSQRLAATAVDGAFVLAGAALFIISFFLFAEATPTLRLVLPMLLAVPAFFWCAYQYLFLVYRGATPGMFVAGLELTTFDDGLVDRRTRRWRAVATVVSCVSLGLGYLWSLVDEDSLTWHDRITRTLVAPERLL